MALLEGYPRERAMIAASGGTSWVQRLERARYTVYCELPALMFGSNIAPVRHRSRKQFVEMACRADAVLDLLRGELLWLLDHDVWCDDVFRRWKHADDRSRDGVDKVALLRLLVELSLRAHAAAVLAAALLLLGALAHGGGSLCLKGALLSVIDGDLFLVVHMPDPTQLGDAQCYLAWLYRVFKARAGQP